MTIVVIRVIRNLLQVKYVIQTREQLVYVAAEIKTFNLYAWNLL